MSYITLKDYLASPNKDMIELGLELFCRDYGAYLTAGEAFEIHDFHILGMTTPDHVSPAIADAPEEKIWLITIDLTHDIFIYQLTKVYDNEYCDVVFKNYAECIKIPADVDRNTFIKRFFTDSFNLFMKAYYKL
jgi:hypothetical protein